MPQKCAAKNEIKRLAGATEVEHASGLFLKSEVCSREGDRDCASV